MVSQGQQTDFQVYQGQLPGSAPSHDEFKQNLLKQLKHKDSQLADIEQKLEFMGEQNKMLKNVHELSTALAKKHCEERD